MPYTFLTPVNMAGLEVRDVRAETVGALPTADSTQAGRYVYHSGQLKYCNGSAWIILGAEGAGGPPSGSASGDLSGSYPGPQVVDDSHAHTGTTISALDAADTTSGVFASARLPALQLIPIATGNVNFNGQQLNGVAAPTAGTDAANKTYVDNLSAGLSWKDAVRAATTANITLSAPQTIDGVAVIATERVLVKNQTTASQNGIYLVAAGAWTRATDADDSPGGEVEGMACFVNEGTTQADTAWVCTTNAPISIGTTSLTFAQFGAGTAIVAGGGLTLTTNTLDIGAGTGITVAADSISVNTTALPVPRQYAVDVGAGASPVINHALNTRDVSVEVFRNSTPWDTILCDVERTDLNNVTLRFAAAVSAAAYRCVVQGR